MRDGTAKEGRPLLAGALACALMLGLFAPTLFGAQVKSYGKGRPQKGWLIESVPYEKWLAINYCGPACLSMLVRYWAPDASVRQAAIAAEVYDAVRKATTNSDMVFYPRAHGLLSYSFRGDLGTLRDILQRNIPVVVLTRPIRQIGKGHYRVVIGLDEAKGLVIFHDPLFGPRRAMKVKSFLRDWDMGPGPNERRWMMAVVRAESEFPFPALREHPLTRINLATAHYRAGRLEESKREWEKARALSGRDPYPVFGLGMVSLRQGRADEAEAYALQALEIDARSAYAEDVLGLAHASRGRIVEALGALGRALRLAPKERFIRDHYHQVRAFYIDNAKRDLDIKRIGGTR